jgi:hypothetical protein
MQADFFLQNKPNLRIAAAGEIEGLRTLEAGTQRLLPDFGSSGRDLRGIGRKNLEIVSERTQIPVTT